MDEATKFFIFCVESYKIEKGMTGKKVVALFNEYGVTDFILQCHNTLHSQGVKALVWELDDFIAHHERKSA
jgi:hypothetical protein